jgi:catechol 2,3-dioxygenase-like lactoylglutathione lyase family enzyme
MTNPVHLGGIHHAAYRCKDAKETVEWYARVLGMTYTTAFAEDHVPSTGEYDPYMHIFLDAGNGNILAFFELPNQPEMGKDPNTPAWVQHLALKVPDEAALLAAKAHIEAQGIHVLGPTHHGIFKSIYFFDPNGHRVELACDTGTPDMYRRLDEVKWAMLEEWSRTRRAPKHAHWMHSAELDA